MEIRPIFNELATREAYAVYADCMYEPTWEKYMEKVRIYKQTPTVSAWSCYDANRMIGLLVIEIPRGQIARIEGIAVDIKYRRQGVGRKLIEHAMQILKITILEVETDSGAVDFYRKCGFTAQQLIKQSKQGKYERFYCVLRK